MTETDIATLHRIARIYGFTIHPSSDYGYGIVSEHCITDHEDKIKSSFWWNESDGFEAFFQEVESFFLAKGFDKCSKW